MEKMETKQSCKFQYGTFCNYCEIFECLYKEAGNFVNRNGCKKRELQLWVLSSVIVVAEISKRTIRTHVIFIQHVTTPPIVFIQLESQELRTINSIPRYQLFQVVPAQDVDQTVFQLGPSSITLSCTSTDPVSCSQKEQADSSFTLSIINDRRKTMSLTTGH